MGEVPLSASLRSGQAIAQLNSETVLFVFGISRFIRRAYEPKLKYGLTQRPQADTRLPQGL